MQKEPQGLKNRDSSLPSPCNRSSAERVLFSRTPPGARSTRRNGDIGRGASTSQSALRSTDRPMVSRTLAAHCGSALKGMYYPLHQCAPVSGIGFECPLSRQVLCLYLETQTRSLAGGRREELQIREVECMAQNVDGLGLSRTVPQEILPSRSGRQPDETQQCLESLTANGRGPPSS